MQPQAEQLRSQCAPHAELPLENALKSQLTERIHACLAGMETFLNYRYQRPKAPPVIWSEGSTQLRDYGSRKEAEALVFLPSLINKSYIFDLLPGHSMIRYFQQEFHPYLIEWNEPLPTEYEFGLAEYRARIGRMLEQVRQPVTLVGYCLGGLLAMQAAVALPERVKRLVLLATPWDFRESVIPLLPPQIALLEQLFAQMPVMPKEWIHTMFFYLQPQVIYDKFARLASLPATSEELQRLLAIEYWLQDGMSMARLVAKEAFIGFGQRNDTLHGRWLNLQEITCPTLMVGGAHDRLVPPAAWEPLVRALPQAETLMVETGHTGLAAGAAAAEKVWQSVMEWLKKA